MDPLAQLSDIHLPTEIHSYPIAPGWWVLLVITLFALFLFARKYLAFKAQRKVQKQLLASLKQDMSIESLSQLLKFALISYYPRSQTASLFGRNLQHYLQQQLPHKKQSAFKSLSGDCFDKLYQHNQGYSSEDTATQFKQSIEFWIRYALPPKKAAVSKGVRDD